MKEENKEKYIDVLEKIFRAFNSEKAPLKVKILLAVAALALSVLITWLGILIR